MSTTTDPDLSKFLSGAAMDDTEKAAVRAKMDAVSPAEVPAGLSLGITAGTACEGDDARLSDARTPTSHTHAVTDIDIAGGEEIGGDLADGDLIPARKVSGTPANKTTMMSRVWTYIAGKLQALGGTFSVGGNWQFASSTLPQSSATTTSSPNDLMTRALGDARYLLEDGTSWRLVPFTGWSAPTGINGGTANTSNTNIATIVAFDTAGATGMLKTASSSANNAFFHTPLDNPWNGFNFGRRIRIRFLLSPRSCGGTGEFVFWVGVASGQATRFLLDRKGFGIVVNGTALRAARHSGTTYAADSGSGGTIAVNTCYRVLLDYYNGTLNVYVNGSLVSTVSGGPSGTAAAGGDCAWVHSFNGDGGGANRMDFLMSHFEMLITAS